VPHVARTFGCQPKAVGGSRRSGPCRALSGRRQDGNYLLGDSLSRRYHCVPRRVLASAVVGYIVGRPSVVK
jgi:hypothetical protein